MWVGRRPRNCFSALCCRAPASSCPLDCEGRYLSSTRQSLPALLRLGSSCLGPFFSLPNSNSNSTSTSISPWLFRWHISSHPQSWCPGRASQALLSLPSQSQTDNQATPPPPPKAWARLPALPLRFSTHSHTPSHQTGPAAAQQSGREAGRERSRQSRAEHHFIIAYYLRGLLYAVRDTQTVPPCPATS